MTVVPTVAVVLKKLVHESWRRRITGGGGRRRHRIDAAGYKTSSGMLKFWDSFLNNLDFFEGPYFDEL